MHESELHGVQVSADQGAPVAQGMVAGVFVWARASVVWLQGGSLVWGCVCGGPGGVRLTDDGLGGHVQVFHKRMPPEAVDLVSRLLQYSPNLRCNAVSGESVGGVFFGGEGWAVCGMAVTWCGRLWDVCSWKRACIRSSMSCGTRTAGCRTGGHCLLCSTSSLKVGQHRTVHMWWWWWCSSGWVEVGARRGSNMGLDVVLVVQS